MASSNSSVETKKRDENRYKPIFTWDKDRVSLIKKDEIDLKEVMKERARGVSIYEMLERYGSVELIPGYGDPRTITERKDGNLKNGCDVDLTGQPEFSTDVKNQELALAEKLYEEEKKKALDAQKAAEEAKAKADAAAKAREEAINRMLEKEKQGGDK